MNKMAQSTIVVSPKGQVVLPKTMRERKQWPAGTRLVIEDTGEGLLLKAAPLFPATRSEDVFASLRVKGPARSVAEMDAGIEREMRRRHAGP
jgi:AbrB family looped-hinge helix DNA binding protein